MGFADGLSQSASTLPLAFDQLGMESLGFSSSAKLKYAGSPVLAWRRQHRRNARSVLPPLQHRGHEDLVLNLADEHCWSAKKAMHPHKGRHSSLPPGLALCKSVAWPAPLEPLWGGVQQGPPLRPIAAPASIKATFSACSLEAKPMPKVGKLSAMVLDLMSDQEAACQTSKSEDISEVPEEELLLPTPEGPVEQHWFSFTHLEAQVKTWRQQVPAPTMISSLHLQECSVDFDDDKLVCSSARVRPGEFLEFDSEKSLEDLEKSLEDLDLEVNMEVDIITEEDVAILAAENAVDDGLRRFLTEVLSGEDGDWSDEEEV